MIVSNDIDFDKSSAWNHDISEAKIREKKEVVLEAI